MQSITSVPDTNEWQPFEINDDVSDFTLLLLDKSSVIGYSTAIFVALTAFWWITWIGFDFKNFLIEGKWWGIFFYLSLIAIGIVLHEGLHFLCADWKSSSIIFQPSKAIVAVKIGGEYHFYRYIACALMPTVVISLLMFPAYYWHNQNLMFISLFNLAGSGLDWVAATIAITSFRGRRILAVQDKFYLSNLSE